MNESPSPVEPAMSRRRPFQSLPLPEAIVAEPAALAACVDHLRTAPAVGYDTEFIGEDTYRPDLCLIQVSTTERLYLIDPLACGPLDAFWETLADPGRITVVHAGREEVRACKFGCGKPPGNLFDVQLAAGLVGLPYPIGYAGLVQEVLGVRANKGETLTDWRRRPLSASQIRYAFDDVRFLLPIWERLKAKLEKRGRDTWATEEFAAFVTWALAEDPTIERWRKLKGLGNLSRRELAVVRAVYGWRDAFAARVNRPPRVLLRDDLILEIARRTPGTAEDLAAVRGLPRGEAETILAAVQAALAAPPDDWPKAYEREMDPPHVATLATLLGVVLADHCAKIDLAQGIAATMADLKALVRGRQPGGSLPPDSGLARGWRTTAVRPVLDAVLDGKSVVRVTDPTTPSPLAVEQAGESSG